MPRRRLRIWALWLLPLLAARAFLPVGFMLSFQGGNADLLFCPSQNPGIVTMLDTKGSGGEAHAHHVDHAAHQSSHGTGVEPPCAFGLAAVAISLDVPSLAGAEPRDIQRPTFDTTFHPSLGPDRADRIIRASAPIAPIASALRRTSPEALNPR
jgi:hypothetical protein